MTEGGRSGSSANSAAIERTALAWWRTELTILGVAALLLKLGLTRHDWLEVTAAGGALTTGLALFVLERLGRAHRTAGERVQLTRIAAAATTLTVALGAASVLH